MKDFISFVLRGAWGGAVVMLLALTWSYGPSGALFLLDPLVLAYSAIPGSIVGLVLWLLAGRISGPLAWIARAAIGAGVMASILLSLNFYQLVSQPLYHLTSEIQPEFLLFYFVRGIEWTLIWATGFGGFAGLACPSTREERANEAVQRLTYLERVRMYEAAESEAREARQTWSQQVDGLSARGNWKVRSGHNC